jgi:hypothetical protein
MADTLDTGAGTPLTAEHIVNLRLRMKEAADSGLPMFTWDADYEINGLLATLDAARSRPATESAGLREAAERTRDLLANYLWNEDDSGDENDLVAAYDELRDILGPSTEAGVGATLARLSVADGPGPEERPEIVCLCGSTRFYDEFQAANYDLTMLGKIVLSVGFYPHALAKHGHGEGVGHDSSEKVALDELHKRKIDLADRVYVLNVNGYIGDSTRSEIEYAEAHGKPVDYLEPGWIAALPVHREEMGP